jgi:electron transfer flavoprotein beta subunit
MGVMKAMKAPVEVLSPSDVGLDGAVPVLDAPVYRAPAQRGDVCMIDGEAKEAAAELVRVLKEEVKVI